MLEIELNSNAKDALAQLGRFSDVMLKKVAAAMDDQNLLTLGNVQQNRLNFSKDGPTQPDGLRHVTGGLFQSPRASSARVIGQTVESAIGSNVVYAGVHEFGFEGTQQVAGFTRANRRRDVYAPRKDGRGATKRIVAEGFSRVRPFSRQMRIPARAPFGNAIADRTQNYSDAIGAAIVDAWNSGGAS